MRIKDFTDQGREMMRWRKALRGVPLSELGRPEDIVVFSADMINGFCKEGNLASDRVGALARPVADFFARVHDAGIERFVLVQEWHDDQADEFSSYGPHCIAETDEAEMVQELANLPFSYKFRIFRKNTLSAAFARQESTLNRGTSKERRVLGPVFERVLDHFNPKTAVVVGNCTDLCVRELAMYLKMWSNQNQNGMRVIIPEDLVETFDLPAEAAASIGVKPHPGDVLHVTALYEMARNGIDVIKEIS